jgi:apolipoprotein N-acyltransferase
VPRLRLTARRSFPFALIIALASGIALSLAFPPVAWWPIAFLAPVPLLWLLRDARPLRGFALGLAFGIGFYGATLYWIALFGAMAWTALTVLSGLSAGLFGLLAPAVRRPGRPILTAVTWASLWTVVDWIRGMWPLGGFTWGALGVSQVTNRITVRLAVVAGVWGVTFVVVAVSGLVLAALEGGGAGVWRGRVLPVAIAALLLVAPLAIPFGRPDGRELKVATIQVDVRQAASQNPANEDVGVAELNIREHAKLAGDPPDLAVWGEGALDPAAAADPATMAAVRDVIASVGAPTLIGAVTDDPDGEHTNVLLFDGIGNQVDRYDKVHLVPFGEYVPFRRRLSWIKALEQVPVDRVPGTSVHTVSVDGLPAFGTPICFENSFPDIPRAMVRDGAGFLVVTVNNASYDFTAASRQHEQMSQMRAIETGRWVANAAVSGISALIDPSGHVTAREGLFDTAILRGTMRSSGERTWYVRLGDWVPWLALLVVAIAFLWPRRRARTRPAPGALADSPRALVILPTFDEAPTIERVIDGVLGAPQDVHVLVVDDASPDGTAEVVRKRAETEPRIHLLERPAKMGLASAYLDGFRRALDDGYDLIVEMDSDLSHDPADLPRLLEAAAERADLAIGSRYVPGGSVSDWSRARVALSRAGNLYVRFMLGMSVRDATSGYRVYRRALLEELISPPPSSDGYGFQVELVMRAWSLGAHIEEVPITFSDRAHGESKISRGIVAEALWLVGVWGLKARLRGVPPVPQLQSR